MKRDLKSFVSVARCLDPVIPTTTQTGVAVDLAGFNAAVVVINAGDVTDGTFTPKIQESDTTTDGDFADVVAADQLGTWVPIDSSHDINMQSVGYIGAKRYIRVVLTVSNAPGTGGPLSAFVVRGYSRDLPA